MKTGIISDIHEDVLHLEKALSILDKEGVDEIVCLGDVVGFHIHFSFEGRNANECIRLVKENCKFTLLGNHDYFALKKVPPPESGFNFPTNWYELDWMEKFSLSDGMIWLYDNEEPTTLTNENILYLNECSNTTIESDKNKRVMFSHYIKPNLLGVQKTKLSFANETKEHLKYMQENNCQLSVCGHFHADSLLIANEHSIASFDFGEQEINRANTIIVAPSVVRSQKRSGIAVLDTGKSVVKTIQVSVD